MEKLIKLFDEYTKKKTEDLEWWAKYLKEKYLLIISKEYWFIQRLVENDKIDLLRLDNRIALSEFNKVERVLMALSIQDNPIEFLISILK